MTVAGRPQDRASVPTRILLGTFCGEPNDPLHTLVRAARAGGAQAISEVLDRVRLSVHDVWPEITSAVVVAVPGHVPGSVNRLLLAVADELAVSRDWEHARGALRRKRPAPEAKAGSARDAMAEAGTLAWIAPPGRGTIILIDDVIRTGMTLEACAASIRATGARRPLVAVAIAARAIATG